MGHAFLTLCLALCAFLAASLGIALFSARETIRDLNLQLQAAAEAERTRESLLVQRSELDQIKDEFISTVSHELRTPLTSIRGALGLLSAGLMGAVDAKAAKPPAHRRHQHRPPHPPHQRHPRSRAHGVRPRPHAHQPLLPARISPSNPSTP